MPEQVEGQCAINSPCRKKLFLSSFFFLSSAYTKPPSLLKSAESFFFYFKFPKHWFKYALSCTLLWLPLLSGYKFILLQI